MNIGRDKDFPGLGSDPPREVLPMIVTKVLYELVDR